MDCIESSESELSDITGRFVLVPFFVWTAAVTNALFLKRLLDCLVSTGLVFCILVFFGMSVKLVLFMYGEFSDLACFNL